MTTRVLTFVCLLFAGAGGAHAQLVPDWNPATHIQLAQCFVAEAQHRERDWSAIAHTLHRWWEIRARRHPSLTYHTVMVEVCSVHRTRRPNRRQRMIRHLRPRFTVPAMPRMFKSDAQWRKQWAVWMRAYAHAEAWQRGEKPDPCRNQAVIWGAPRTNTPEWHKHDNPYAKGYPVVRLRCSDNLKNDYYRRMTMGERKKFYAKRGMLGL